MAINRCFLCGGRVSKGVCTECGMPQRQQAENYDLNKSECDDKPLTHVHKDKLQTSDHRDPAVQRQKSIGKETHPDPEKIDTYYRAYKHHHRYWSFRLVLTFIGLIVVVAAFTIFAVKESGVFKVSEDNTMEQEMDEDILTVDDSGYSNVMYEMPADGEPYTADAVFAGYYRVGYDMPEGVYDISAVYGKGMISVTDEVNGIDLYETINVLPDGYGYSEVKNVMLYQGAEVRIEGSLELEFSTENAQMDKMIDKAPNELTEAVTIAANSICKAGEDFPAGVYDIYCVDLFGSVDIYKYVDDTETHYYMNPQLLQSEEDAENRGQMEEYALGIYNVNLEEGVYVFSNDTPLKLVPSEYVIPEEGE